MPSYTIVATPAELDARDGWWKWEPTDMPKVNVNSADKWLRPAGYVADEVKRALVRSVRPEKRAKRNRDGSYAPLNYTLPKPTLEAISNRLARAELREVVREDGQTFTVAVWTGPRAAEQWTEARHAELEAVRAERLQRLQAEADALGFDLQRKAS